MVDYFEQLLEEYEIQLDYATNSEMNNFWQGAIFAMKVALLTAQAKEASE